MTTQQAGDYQGREAATARLILDVSDMGRNFALLAIDPAGDITVLIPDRATFDQLLANSRGGRPIERIGNGRYAVHIDADHTGWSGVMLVSGQAPFDPPLVSPRSGARPGLERAAARDAAQPTGARMVLY